jgi:hypothetical protein
MTEQKLRTETEPIDPWVAINCNGGCSKPAEWQEAVYQGDTKIPIKVGHCGDPDCQKGAAKKALEMAPYPMVQELAAAGLT